MSLRGLSIAVDLDNTLAQYTHETYDEHEVGPPMEGALRFVQALFEEGAYPWIFTARASTINGTRAAWRWAVQYGFDKYIAGITHEKLFTFFRFVDDRAIAFNPDEPNYMQVLQQLRAATDPNS